MLILHNNIFLFNGDLYSQEIGAGMGTKPAPDYANIFLARRIDEKINQISEKYSDFQNIDFMKRFLDDIFKIFVGSSKQLHNFFEEINTIHPTIKFTMSHTRNATEDAESCCSCPQQDYVPFLDTSCKIENRKIILDL
jgi:archaellum component FlaC